MSTTLTPQLDEAARRREELRGVIAMSVPMVITTCTRMVMDVTDYLMVSRLTEGAAQAALLPAQLLLWTFIVIGMGITSMVATFAAQCLGRKRYRDCSAYAWQSLYIAAIFGVLGYGYWLLLPGLVAWMGHDLAVQAAELDYCRVAIWSVGPTIAAAGLSAFFNGIHHPKTTMWSSIEGIVVNMVVSYCLIFGKFGLPAMGIAGAAFGTVVATSYRVLRLTVTLCLPRINEKFHGRATWRPDRAKLVGILRLGVPQGAQWFSDVVVWMIFISVLIGRMFGTDHLIANNAAWQYLRMSFMPTIGMGMALTALIGKAIGQGDPQRAIRQTRMGVGMVLAYMATLSVVYLIWRRELIGFFNTDPQIVTIGASIMICAAVFQVFDGMGIVYTCALRGAGDTTWPSIVFVISHWTILVGGGYLMAVMFPSWGSIGPWVAGTTLLVLLGFVLWYRWHSRAWMKIDIFKHEKAADADPSTVASQVELAVESGLG